MTSELKIRKFLAMEKENNPFNFQVDGWSIWRVMRNSVFRINRELPINSLNRPQAKRIVQAIMATFKLFVLILSAKKSDIMVKTCQSGLRLKDGHKFKDIYFDSILPFYNYIKLEEKNNAEFDLQSRQAAFPSSLDPVVFTFWGKVLGRLFPVSQKEACKQISKLLEHELLLTVSHDFLLMRISTVYWQAKLYGALLNRVKPKIVLVSDTGEYALKLASCKLGIKMIELQHGVFDSDHPDAIPSWVNGSNFELLLPDVLACKGNFWINTLNQTRQGISGAIAVGNNSIDLARETRKAIKKTKIKNHIKIVVTSQGLDTENLVSWLKEIGAHLNDFGIDWSISLKLHPAYDANHYLTYKQLTNDRIEVIPGHCHPSLFELLTKADVHLSISSASHFDALAIGVPSIVIPLTDAETMQKYTNNTHFFYSENPLHAAQIVKSLNCTNEEFSYTYSEPNFVDNMRRLIG